MGDVDFKKLSINDAANLPNRSDYVVGALYEYKGDGVFEKVCSKYVTRQELSEKITKLKAEISILSK